MKIQPATRPRLDVRAIIEHFGGPPSLVNFVTAAGFDLSARTCHKWAERGSIPTARLLEIYLAAEFWGQAFDLRKFIVKDPT